jgi:hypothetical protein
MKKLISLTFVLSLFILSCSSNDSQDNTAPGPVLVRKTITTSSQGTVTTNINYNGNKIVNATSSNGEETKYYYTGDLITKTETYSNNVLFRSVLYSYNSQNELISGVELNHNTNYGTKTILTYNSNGTISYNMYDGDLISQTWLWGTYTATLTNGEITSFKDENTNFVETCIYDLKNTTMKNVLGTEKLSNSIGSGTYRNIGGKFHNLVEQKTTPQTGNQYIFRNIQYTYNSDDYPITGSRTTYTSNGAITAVINISYFYE